MVMARSPSKVASTGKSIERATDLQEADVVEALGEDVDELFELMAPWARAVVAAAGRIAR